MPPQSTPVSPWFLMASEQVAATQVSKIGSQFNDAQSVPARQPWSSPHGAQEGPPQSLSVSAPFGSPPAQAAALQTPWPQTPLPQPAGTPHFFPGAQRSHVPPPQSLSVSAPFFTP